MHNLPGAYVVNSPKPGQYCGNCMHYINNYCTKFIEEVAPYGWCKVWQGVQLEV
jgi:hypothetical protein